MNINEAIRICNEFKNLLNDRPYRYGMTYMEILDTCEKLKILGYEWGDPLPDPDFKICKGNYYVLTNPVTKYNFDPDKYYIHWDNGNIGQFQFVSERIFYEGFEKFLNKLHSYNPLDWDPYNCHIIYNIEDGKRLIDDYADIVKATREEAAEVTKKYRERQLEEELKRLRSE